MSTSTAYYRHIFCISLAAISLLSCRGSNKIPTVEAKVSSVSWTRERVIEVLRRGASAYDIIHRTPPRFVSLIGSEAEVSIPRAAVPLLATPLITGPLLREYYFESADQDSLTVRYLADYLLTIIYSGIAPVDVIADPDPLLGNSFVIVRLSHEEGRSGSVSEPGKR